MVTTDSGYSMFPDGTNPQLEPKLKVPWHAMQPDFPENVWDVIDENCSMIINSEKFYHISRGIMSSRDKETTAL